MTIIMTTLLSLHLTVAVWFDLRERRIPNAVILSGLVQGLAVALLDGGASGFVVSLLGACVGTLVFFPFFLLKLMGAGDAKLLGVVGAFTGAPALLPITVYTVLAGGLLGLVALVWARSVPTAVSNLRDALFTSRLRAQGARLGLSDAGLKTTARIPYALAIAAGVAFWEFTRS